LVESREIRRRALLNRQLGVKINDKPYGKRVVALTHSPVTTAIKRT